MGSDQSRPQANQGPNQQLASTQNYKSPYGDGVFDAPTGIHWYTCMPGAISGVEKNVLTEMYQNVQDQTGWIKPDPGKCLVIFEQDVYKKTQSPYRRLIRRSGVSHHTAGGPFVSLLAYTGRISVCATSDKSSAEKAKIESAVKAVNDFIDKCGKTADDSQRIGGSQFLNQTFDGSAPARDSKIYIYIDNKQHAGGPTGK